MVARRSDSGAILPRLVVWICPVCGSVWERASACERGIVCGIGSVGGRESIVQSIAGIRIT